VSKRKKYHHQTQAMRNISQMAAAVSCNTVYILSANCPFYLYHKTETSFRIESETGLAN